MQLWRLVISLIDSLVGLYLEVSAFLKLVSIFVPAEGRAGISRRLALQVQLVPFHQGLASHQPQFRSRGWTEGERKTEKERRRDIQSEGSCEKQGGREETREINIKH